MARSRSPDRDKAYELWMNSGGVKQLKDIAVELGVSPSQVRNWKAKDNWEAPAMIAQLNSNDCVTKPKGAPLENKNAVGNSGGPGGPPGNDKAVSHGFFRRIFPDDEETLSIIDEIGVKSPIEMLWENIVIQYTAIARAQKIMFVRDQNDVTKEVKKTKSMSNDKMDLEETEYEIQYAWDKQANFLQAQSRAISTLEGLISRYEAMLPNSLKMEEQRLKLEKVKADIDKLKGNNGDSDKAKQWAEVTQRMAERRKNQQVSSDEQ